MCISNYLSRLLISILHLTLPQALSVISRTGQWWNSQLTKGWLHLPQLMLNTSFLCTHQSTALPTGSATRLQMHPRTDLQSIVSKYWRSETVLPHVSLIEGIVNEGSFFIFVGWDSSDGRKDWLVNLVVKYVFRRCLKDTLDKIYSII